MFVDRYVSINVLY